MRAPHFLTPLIQSGASRAGGYALTIDGRAAVLASTIEPAFDSKTRNRGLLGRDRLADGTALIIAPSNSVHTFGMRFAIDLIYAARDGRVVKIRAAVPRSRISLALGAFAVIEMAAGSAEKAGLRAGDRLVLKSTHEGSRKE
ncbi:MAG TPA: DUF192 domain-containing protein [Vicinamibacterales bacterium]|nr:DUF192 domain-containing protein [Vicinamibacterales bacterium]